jgi:hypothetical protein
VATQGLGVAVGVREGDGVGVRLGVTETDGVEETVGEIEGLGVALKLGETVGGGSVVRGDGEADGVALGLGVGLGPVVGVALGETLAVGLAEGLGEGDGVGLGVGWGKADSPNSTRRLSSVAARRTRGTPPITVRAMTRGLSVAKPDETGSVPVSKKGEGGRVVPVRPKSALNPPVLRAAVSERVVLSNQETVTGLSKRSATVVAGSTRIEGQAGKFDKGSVSTRAVV